MGNRVDWKKLLVSQGCWARLLADGVCSWNLRGLWIVNHEIRDDKCDALLTLLRKYKYVCVQEPHLTSAVYPVFLDWCFNWKVFHFSVPTNDIEQGVLILSFTDLSLDWSNNFDTSSYSSNNGAREREFLYC